VHAMTPNGTDAPVRRLLLKPDEAARVLGISLRTLWGSDIPKVRVGKRGVRYHIQDIHDWIGKRKVVRDAP